jgi:hypothetical protein
MSGAGPAVGVPVDDRRASPGGGKKHLLIIGRADDPCCTLVADYARSNGYGSLLLPENDLFPQLGFTWLPPSEGTITWHDAKLRFTEISGVLNRGYGVPVTADEYETSDGRYLTAEWNALTAAWLHLMPCPVVNRLRPELWYRPRLNVADLATLAPDLRDYLPPALVTTQSEEIRGLPDALAAEMFYTPLTSGAQYPVRTVADLGKLETLGQTVPLQLIRLQNRSRLQCFVIAEEVICLGPDGEPTCPPSSDLRLYCVSIGKELGILFYKLSLLEKPRGEWCCMGLDRLPPLYSCSPAVQQQIASNLGRIMCDRAE